MWKSTEHKLHNIWRSVEFLRNEQNWGKNLLCGKTFAENCMKMKQVGPREARILNAPSRDPLMESKNVTVSESGIVSLFLKHNEDVMWTPKCVIDAAYSTSMSLTTLVNLCIRQLRI